MCALGLNQSPIKKVKRTGLYRTGEGSPVPEDGVGVKQGGKGAGLELAFVGSFDVSFLTVSVFVGFVLVFSHFNLLNIELVKLGSS